MRQMLFLALGAIALCLMALSPINIQGQNITITEANLMKQVGKVPENFLVSAIGMAKKIEIENPQSLAGKGVSQTIIDALIKRKAELAFSEPATPAPVVTPSATPQVGSKACPEKEGVYLNSPTGWVAVDQAPQNEMSQNYTAATNPFGRKTSGIKLDGPEAPTKTSLKPEFCAVGPMYTSSPRGIMLVKVAKRGKDREIVMNSSGAFRKTKMMEYDKLDTLQVEKSGENLLLEFNSEVAAGEYALKVGMFWFDFSARQ